MRDQDYVYHSQRALQCREWAERAADTDVRRRHLELAELHARRAAESIPMDQLNSIDPQRLSA